MHSSFVCLIINKNKLAGLITLVSTCVKFYNVAGLVEAVHNLLVRPPKSVLSKCDDCSIRVFNQLIY